MFVQDIIVKVTNFLEPIFFYEILHFPLLMWWIIAGGIFVSFSLFFPALRLFKHGLDTVFTKKYKDSPSEIGEITPKQALFTSISSTVGLGSIAGAAVAVAMGGPGAIFWIFVYTFFGMNNVFNDTVLTLKYRHVDESGKVNGGPFRYIKSGMEDIGKKKTGAFLSNLYAILFMIGGFGVAPLFQTNQVVSIITENSIFANWGVPITVGLAILSMYILIGGAKRLGKILDTIIPLMVVLYTASLFIIIAVNIKVLPAALAEIFKDAFGFGALGGGALGGMVIAASTGLRRASFSTEASLGSTTIAHVSAKTSEPVRQAAIASVNPIMVIFFSCLTGLVVVMSGVYKIEGIGDGVLMTSAAFATVSIWFKEILTVVIVLFGFSTVLGYGYYSQTTWAYVFKGYKTIIIHNIIYCILIVASAFIDFMQIVRIADILFLSVAIPNLIASYFLIGKVKEELSKYMTRLKSGEFNNS